jgi:hypothetical protein
MLRLSWLVSVLAALAIVPSALSATITIENTSVCVQSICDFGTTNAALPNATNPAPIVIERTDPSTGITVDTGARLYSMQVCLSGDPSCPTGGSSPVGLFSNIRFTNVDLVCPAGPDCTAFGLGFTFSGHLDGSFVFDFLLSDVSVAVPTGGFIFGNMSLDLSVDGATTNSFLPFDSRSGTTFGPVSPILVSGSSVPYSAYGTLIIAGMPANSELKILHSGEFRFAQTVPEPPTAIPVAVLGVLGVCRHYLRNRREKTTARWF